MHLTPEFEALLHDQEAGASTLLYRYIQILRAYFSAPDINQEERVSILNDFYAEVTDAHPLMAIFPNLHRFIHGAFESGEYHIPNIIDQFHHQIDENIDRTIHAARALFQNADTVFTFSHSSIVRKAILQAWKDGERFAVITTEARPVREGVNLAKVLARADIPVTLYTDAAMECAVTQSDLVIVGTDWYSPAGFVNKIGTHSALRMAQEKGKGFAVLTDSSKAMNTEPENWSRDQHAAIQVLTEDIENMTVKNPYFEWMPYPGVTDFIVNGQTQTITEEGFLIL